MLGLLWSPVRELGQSGGWGSGGSCEAIVFPYAWRSLPFCSASQSARIRIIPSGKIISVGRGSVCMEIESQSRENGWKKEQYPAITFLDYLRVLFLPAVHICLRHSLSLLAWAEGSGTIQPFTVQPAERGYCFWETPFSPSLSLCQDAE